MKKIEHLEGLRGLACLIVVISHYMQFYFHSVLFSNPTFSAKYLLSKTPLNLFYNGNFAICIFFILSGYVLSINFLSTNNYQSLVESSVKRYFRLMIPVFVSVIIAYFLLIFGAYNYFTLHTNDLRYTTMNQNFFTMLKYALFDVFFKNTITNTKANVTYIGVLWTMNYEFLGSFLVFSFLSLFGTIKKRYVFYLVLITFFYNTYFLAFILGLLLCDLNLNKHINSFKPIIFIFLIIGLFLGSYPYGKTENTIYNFLNVKFLILNYRTFYHIIGAFFIMISVLNSSILKNILSSKLFVFLGKISFSLYLTHFLILTSFSFLLFDKLINVYSYKLSFIISFSMSIPVTFLVSYIMYKYIDTKALFLSKFIYMKFFKKES